MLKKTVGVYATISIILLVSISMSFVSSHQASAVSPTGVIIPLYSYPTNAEWNAVAQAKLAHPSVPIIAIINPNSGSGITKDTNFVIGIQNLQAAGVVVVGYVPTKYGAASISSAETMIDNYKNWYSVNGINFDQMANVAGYENYYSTLSTYAKVNDGMSMTVGNPGADTLPSYIGTVDNITIYEGAGVPPILNLEGWHTSYSKSNFSMVAYAVSSLDSTFVSSASNYVGYMYITDATLPNPYDTIPSYWNTLVADLDTGSSATVPQPPTGLTASPVSASQINLSWIAPNNGGSVITGYKIERSTDGGTTWSVTVPNTGSTATSYSDTGLNSGTTYTYRISAINAIGTGSPSSSVSATTNSIILDTTNTIITPNPASVTRVKSIQFMATVSDIANAINIPTGTIQWNDGGAGGTFLNSGSCTLSSGSCSITYSAPSHKGTVQITGIYGGDLNHQSSTGASTLTVKSRS